MITVTGHKHITVTCETDAEIDAIAGACRVVSRGKNMRATVNNAEYRAVLAIAERFNGSSANPKPPATAYAARVLCGYNAEFAERSQVAPKTIVRDGVTLSFTGYGRAFRINNPDCGLEPHFSAARYAYYA
jgi:hypothetical protein